MKSYQPKGSNMTSAQVGRTHYKKRICTRPSDRWPRVLDLAAAIRKALSDEAGVHRAGWY